VILERDRLHTAGHLLDACMGFLGLGSLEPGKGHHFPERYVFLTLSDQITKSGASISIGVEKLQGR